MCFSQSRVVDAGVIDFLTSARPRDTQRQAA
jgi:hypothetical protein